MPASELELLRWFTKLSEEDTMDKLSIEVLKELLPGEKEFTPPPAKPRGPQMDHWPPAVLLERAAYLRKMAKAGMGRPAKS